LIQQHKKVKIYRKFKQDKRDYNYDNIEGDSEQPSNQLTAKIDKYRGIEKMIEDYEKKLIDNRDNNIEPKAVQPNSRPPVAKKEVKPALAEQQGKKGKDDFLQKKRKSKEEYEKEKAVKLEKRKKIYKNLNKKTPKGQPVMRYQVKNLLAKIKDKISKGAI
jgi:hypothetical protein